VNRTERAARVGEVPYYGATGQVGWIDDALFDEELCLVGEDGAPFLDRSKTKAYVIDGPSWVNNHAHVLRAIRGLTSNRFLKHLLDATDYASFVNGTTRLKLTKSALNRIPVPLPPLNEQRRIVAAIEEHLSRLDAADASLAAGDRRAKLVREHAAMTAMRGDWPAIPLGEIAEVVGGVTKDAKRQSDPDYVEVPYLRVANVQRGFLDLGEVTTIRVPAAKARALALRAGDVLFNEGGDRDKLGRGWVWSGEIEGCIHQNHVFRARLNGDYDPRFVSWHGNTIGRSWFETRGKQTTNLASLNLTTLKAFPIPAIPLDEQRRIVAQVEERLSAIDALRAAIERAQRRSASLRRAILERAFRGELVPQDPTDEPAEALLARIRAERDATAPPSRRRKVAK
jgi:type I restriction enzyme S subunit